MSRDDDGCVTSLLIDLIMLGVLLLGGAIAAEASGVKVAPWW